MMRMILYRRVLDQVARTLVALLLAFLAGADDKIDFKKMVSLSVHLMDEQGNPVEGARVMPYAMRMKEQEGHGFWNRELLGPPKTATSDKTGVAVIQYPIRVSYGAQTLTTRLVTFEVTHTDFVKQTVHFELELGEPRITLKAGCEVQISAVDGDENPIEDFGVMMAGPYEPKAWAKAETGGRRTRSINDGTWQTMLVKVPDQGPILFSNVLPLRVQPQQTVRIRQVRLTPGARVRGRLNDRVPRPVRGYVIATSVPKPAENSWHDKDPSVAWHEWVDVAPDGTFEFPSLPRGGQVQLIGICDGWISSTMVADARVFVMGELFDVEQDLIEVELQMEPTGTLEVKIVGDGGKPFTEGRVASWPNQAYYKGGSTLLGQRFRSADYIRNQLLSPEKQLPVVDVKLKFPYDQPVGMDGVARLTGLPVGRSLSFVLMHGEYKISTPDGPEGRGEVNFELPSPQPGQKEVTIIAGRK